MSKIIDNIFSEGIPGLQKALDLSYRRNEAISSNIANAETPQYRAVDLNFAGELERAFTKSEPSGGLLKTDPKHMDVTGNGEAHLLADYSGATKSDGNNVDIDVQMGRLAYNSGRYSLASNLIRRQLQFLKNAIREGAR